MKVQQFEAERNVLQDELAVAKENIQALIAELSGKDLELTTAHSKAEDNSHTISHMEGLVKGLEGQLSSVEERRKAHGQFQFKQGRIEALRICSGLGFELVTPNFLVVGICMPY